MKILVISNLYPSIKNPFYGSFVKNFVEELKIYYSESQIDKCVLKGKSKSIFGKILKYIAFYCSIIWKLLLNNYDFVYVHLITHSTIPVWLVSKVKKLNLIFNIHGQDLLVTTPLAAKLLNIAKPLVYQAKLVVVPSYYFKEITIKNLPLLEPDKIFVSASGGISSQFFNNVRKQNDIPIIGFVSRIDEGKGWDIFLKAAKILSIEDIKARFIIAGGGLEVPEMKILMNELELKGVEYCGPKRYSELPSLYSLFDLFVFPTKLEESLGLVGLEAMAVGIPIISSEIGGMKDYINNGINGFFFEPGNEKDLADKIKTFFKLSEIEKQRMSNEAKNTALTYRADVVAKNLFDYITVNIISKE